MTNYNLNAIAVVDDDVERDEDIFEISKSRAMWLAINLVTVVAASSVIGMFDKIIQNTDCYCM